MKDSKVIRTLVLVGVAAFLLRLVGLGTSATASASVANHVAPSRYRCEVIACNG